MTDLAGISGKQVVRAFTKIGYTVVRQKGSHVRLKHKDDPNRRPITIPLHKEIGVGLMYRFIRDAGITSEEFKKLL
ncbi:type II toxin-antitoxin system HicA family toxin [Candidatus Uhrbacteria bacterium]|nr:type II toxin-antitoxin system HicA family toxin [Candidatus Uhrbacteria bacterium]